MSHSELDLSQPCIVFHANTARYLRHFRLPLAKRLQERGCRILFACPDGPDREELVAQGFTWIPTRIHRFGLNPLSDLRSAWGLAAALRVHRPAAIHNFTLKAILIGTLAARLARTPRIINAVTGLGYLYCQPGKSNALPRRLLTRFFHWSFRQRGIRTIFQNDEDRRLLLKPGSPGEYGALIPGSGVDLTEFHPAPDRPAKGSVILAARLLKDKGVLAFCEASRIVRMQWPDTPFVIAGAIDPDHPGSFSAAEIEAMRADYPTVSFLGFRKDMPHLLRHAAMAVLPSRYGEGVPRILAEAAASGLPLIALDGPGIRSILEDGVNGILISRGGSGELAEAVSRILGDPALAERFGQGSRRIAVERFDQELVFKETLGVYADLGLRLHAAGTGIGNNPASGWKR